MNILEFNFFLMFCYFFLSGGGGIYLSSMGWGDKKLLRVEVGIHIPQY